MKQKFLASGITLTAFILWTVIVRTVDVQPIGPLDSAVGLATINRAFFSLTGVHMKLYTVTDQLSIIPLGIVLLFAVTGLLQWIRRKKITLVDRTILALGGFYILVMALFLFFEIFVVNYRPVLIDGIPEASYPSSTTMLVLCVMPTAMMQIRRKITNLIIRRTAFSVMGIFTAFMVIARAVSGVHWLTDIIAGALLSAGLVTLYCAVCERHIKQPL